MTESPRAHRQSAAPRLHVPLPLLPDGELELPPGAARHAQVLRLQPGSALTLFNGAGGECRATVIHMGRSSARVRVGAHAAIEREATRHTHVLAGLMASERMDWLVEKATELGVASIAPVLTQHCALRPGGPHAAKKHAHWQAVAVAACEQSGRNRLPAVRPIRPLNEALADDAAAANPARASRHAAFRPRRRPERRRRSASAGRRLCARQPRPARAPRRNRAAGGTGAAFGLSALLLFR